MEKEKLEKEIEELKKTVKELSQIIEEMREKDMGRGEPTGVRRQILDLLEEQSKPCTVKEIADLIGRAETTVSGYLLDLHESGYLERKSELVNVSPTRRVRQFEYSVPQEKKRRWHYL